MDSRNCWVPLCWHGNEQPCPCHVDLLRAPSPNSGVFCVHLPLPLWPQSLSSAACSPHLPPVPTVTPWQRLPCPMAAWGWPTDPEEAPWWLPHSEGRPVSESAPFPLQGVQCQAQSQLQDGMGHAWGPCSSPLTSAISLGRTRPSFCPCGCSLSCHSPNPAPSVPPDPSLKIPFAS